ncbi:MAG: hypothetical protein ACE5E5_08835 [Phycisphaerae bacterium]
MNTWKTSRLCDVRITGQRWKQATCFKPVPSSCLRAGGWRRWVLWGVVLCSAAGSGCGMSQGRLLYFMGFGKRETVKAQYRLTQEPILILVDDLGGQVDWPPTIGYLREQLGRELIAAGGANRIVPPKTLDAIRSERVDYDQLSARRIGELCGARQVLWVEIDQYFADPEFFEPTDGAWLTATIKVIDVVPEGSRARVWPMTPRGHHVSVMMDGSAVARAKTKDAIAKRLTEELTTEVVRLFTDYVPGDFED